jgi:hypothetical protein
VKFKAKNHSLKNSLRFGLFALEKFSIGNVENSHRRSQQSAGILKAIVEQKLFPLTLKKWLFKFFVRGQGHLENFHLRIIIGAIIKYLLSKL